MNIHSITPSQSSLVYSKSPSVQTENTGVLAFSIGETVENIQGPSPERKDSSTIYEELSSIYDVRNATFEEITQISKALYEAGEITLKEHATLTFDFGRGTNDLKP